MKASKDQLDTQNLFDVGGAVADISPSVKSVGITGQITGTRADLLIPDDKLNVVFKPCEFGGTPYGTIPSQDRKVRCNDYSERKYTQVSGSAWHYKSSEDIV